MRARDAHRLSEQEAGVIAARLVARIQARVPVTEAQAEAIRVRFVDIFKRRLTGDRAGDPAEVEAQVLEVLQIYLAEKDIAVLKDSLPRNVRPLPGEK